MTWGADFGETVPPAILKVTQKIGGVAAGAFSPNGQMVGFVYGLSGVRDGRLGHWSHMLAVRPEMQNRGIGRSLKDFQKEALLTRGIEVMYWTFDPLVARNANLNLNALGAQVDEYVEDMYGPPGRGPLDRVIGTDRFIIRWELVRKSREFRIPLLEKPSPAVANSHDEPVLNLLEADQVSVEVPEDIQTLKNDHPDKAEAWRAATREAFQHYLGAGYAIESFHRNESGRGGSYILVRSRAID